MRQPGSKPSILRPAAGFAGASLLFLAGVAGMFGAAASAPHLGIGLRSQIALGTLLFALPVAAAVAFEPRARRPVLGDAAPGVRTAALSLLLGAALWVASIGLVELQSLVRPPLEEELDLFRRLHAALAPRGALDAIVSLAVIAVLPAVCEELVMRGALLMSLLPFVRALLSPTLRDGPARLVAAALSVAVTAAVFALIHDPVRFLFAFALGVALGAVRLRTGRRSSPTPLSTRSRSRWLRSSTTRRRPTSPGRPWAWPASASVSPSPGPSSGPSVDRPRSRAWPDSRPPRRRWVSGPTRVVALFRCPAILAP
jgi:membrane protease YdiL (CAAX protease family)